MSAGANLGGLEYEAGYAELALKNAHGWPPIPAIQMPSRFAKLECQCEFSVENSRMLNNTLYE